MTNTREEAARLALAGAAEQDAVAAEYAAVIIQETARLAQARADLRRAHRKATRPDRPNSHHTGRAEEAHLRTDVLPGIERALADAQAEHDHYAQDAARLRALAATDTTPAQEAPAVTEPTTTTTAPTVSLVLPGAFCNYFDGTNVAQGLDNSDPECAATHAAWQDATSRRYGRHGYTVTVTTGDVTVLNLFEEYAENCLESNADEPDPKEVKAARETLTRVQTARKELRTAQDAAQAQEAPQEAPTAAEGPVRADWERDLPATPAATTPAAPFSPTDPATWAETPEGYEWREIDAETGECHLFAPDGTNLSAALPTPTATNTVAQMRAATPARRSAPAAPQGLADWERDLLAAADTLPAADREPSADLNIAQGDDPQDPAHAPASVWVTTQDGERIEYAHIPNGDPARVAAFLADARAVPTFTDVSTEQRPAASEEDPYPAHNTQGRCTHGDTCRYNRPDGTPGEWIHPDADRTPCTANPTIHVTWTGTVKGHHHATVTLPGGARARITYIPRGTTHTFIGRASMGIGSPIVARAMSLSTLLHRYAQMSGYQTFTFEEYGTPDRPATAADYTTA